MSPDKEPQRTHIIKLNKHQLPDIKEVHGKDWIAWGKKNDYPEYLLRLFSRSSKHNAIVTAKATYIAGSGFVIENPTVSVEDKARILSFLSEANDDESYNQLLDKIALDYEIFNGFAIEFIWNKSGRDFEIYHVPFNNVRCGKDKDTYYYTQYWWKDGRENYKPEEEEDFQEYAKFDPEKSKGKQLLYFTFYRPDLNYYPKPDYCGAIPYIETDYEIANFWLNNIKNGFAGGTIINLNNGYPKNDEEAERIVGDLKASFTGTDNAGEIVVIFSDNKEKGVDIVPLRGNDFDKMYIQLNDTVQQEIFTGHKISSPMIFGVKTPGQLGGRAEMREAFELFTNTYTKPRRKHIESVFNFILQFKKLPPVISIGNLEPIMQEFSEETIKNVMTPDEIRERIGLKPLPKIQPQQMSKRFKFSEKEEVNIFKKYGKAKADFKVHSSKSFKFSDYESLWKEELKQREEFAKVLVINDMQASIIDLILKDPLISPEQIIETIGANEGQVRDAIGKMVQEKIIAESNKGWSVDKEVSKAVKKSDVQTTDIFIAYSYEVVPGLGAPIIEGTRDFCRELIGLNRFYERSDIEMISAEVDRNVWLTRGGFYNNPSTGEITPYCRHEWKSNIVSKNG